MTGPSPRAAGRLDFRSVLERRRTPLSTYRLQLNPEFGFTQAAALAAYLDDLGITDCYTSPILKTRPGSAHGYDVADCGAINPELGGEAGFRDFAAALRARGMGYLLDVVPNHMSTDPRANLWWRDVLENGPASEFADFFDIDWEPETPELQGKVLLPILEDQYGAVLERGELRLRCARGA
ncbi:MAG TPA: alpha-amylase family glycosyl hydrolase, partial [Elusimicrobiota bacterium]|nr:alpha-amylase family glycosyl hydrolase [Elusimicrobiota bacterium]